MNFKEPKRNTISKLKEYAVVGQPSCPVLLALLVGLLSTALGVSAASGAQGGQQADMFKAFIEHPPVIKRIIWERSNPNNIKVTSSFFFGKWQPNAMLIKICTDLDTAIAEEPKPNISSIDARWEDNYWRYFDHALTIWTNADRPEESTNYVIKMYYWEKPKLANVLNFGITYADIGDIKWQGDSFNYTNQMEGHILQGTLSRDQEGKAEKILLHLNLRDPEYADLRKFTWEIDYKYETNLSLAFLPNKLEYFLIEKDNQRVPLDTIRIYDIQTNADKLEPESFAPEAFVKVAARNTYFIRGGSTVYQDDNKQWATLAPVPHSKTLRIQTHKYRIIALVLLLTPVVLFFSLMVRRKRKTNQNNQTNKK